MTALKWLGRVPLCVIACGTACGGAYQELVSVSGEVASAAISGDRVVMGGSWMKPTLRVINLPAVGVVDDIITDAVFQAGGVAGALALEGSTLIAVTQEALVVFDISEAGAPKELARAALDVFPGTLLSLALSEGIAALGYTPDRDGAGSELSLWDVHDPRRPRQLSQLTLPSLADQVADVAIRGSRLLVAARLSGFYVFDVSDLMEPSLLAHEDVGTWARGIDLKESVVYVSTSMTRGASTVRVFSVTDAGEVQLLTSLDTPGIAQDVAVDGTRLYVADREGGFRVYGISTPESPEYLGRVRTQGHVTKVSVAHGTVVAWNDSGGAATVYRERR